MTHPTTRLALAAGKLARQTARLRRRGGSALPGLVAETIDPKFLARTLGHLPGGIVIVTGTNGKTTTTKMIADLLTGLGMQVLTNKSGSNFTRGIAATIIEESRRGKPLHHDIAVIELDEAYAKVFARIVKPRYVVALNVIRDQLDRFGEVDATARLIESVLQQATGACIVNGNDPRLVAISKQLTVPVHYYTVHERLRPEFPADEELLAISDGSMQLPRPDITSAVELESFTDGSVTYRIGGHAHTSPLAITGQYNYQNAAAVVALVRLVTPEISVSAILKHLAGVQPAFGRGDTLRIGNDTVQVVLVKNPAGFRQSLRSFTSPAATMIAINDNDADGRDVSWLWDVNFDNLEHTGVQMASGIRAHDMALRLQYDDVKVDSIEPKLPAALRNFLISSKGQPKRIFCTYTAMLPLHAELSSLAGQKRAL